MKIPDPIDYMARLCKARVKNGGEDNYHIFLNSVEGIVRIIRLAALRPEDCRIVCSQSTQDIRDRNQKKLGNYPISTNQDPVRLFNFYTSTCFEGQDILDPVGRTFIVSEPYKDHTKVDIMTTLPQICGRIRDSKYKYEINQFYAESEYKDVSLEEYKAYIEKRIQDAEHDAECLNNMTQRGKESIMEYVKKAPYLGVSNGKIVVDRNLAYYKIVHYGIVNGQYAPGCNMNSFLEQAGFTVTNDVETNIQDVQLETPATIERTPFKKIFEEYVEIRTSKGYNLDCFRRSRIEIEKPLVKEAYEKLGAKKVREMKYHQSNIKRELIKLENETLVTKVFLLLDGQLAMQVAIPGSVIIAKLNAIYKELGIEIPVKARHIGK